MAVRTEERRGRRVLIIDIRFRKPDGTKGRYRHDAEVQTLASARAEDRRRLAAVALTGAPGTGLAQTTSTDATSEEKPRATCPTFATVAEQYQASYAVSNLKPSTKFGYDKVIKALLVPRLGRLAVDTIDANVVRELDVNSSRQKFDRRRGETRRRFCVPSSSDTQSKLGS